MNFLTINVFTSCKNLVKNRSASLNDVISRNVQFSCIITGRKKPHTLWPNKPKQWAGGMKYYGFTYYPRYPDQHDPHWEPTELFMVRRRKSWKGTPRWLKIILRNLRIEQDNNEVAIVINSEHNNKMLWKIKHLVTIIPITFPDGRPEEKDLDSCRLYENGELRISPVLKIDPEKMKATENFQRSLDRIDKETIQKYTRKQWIDGYHVLKDF